VTPGSDGFGVSFFQDHWAIIKDQLCFANKEFFNFGKLLKVANHTLIALVSKVNNSKRLRNFDQLVFVGVYIKYWPKF